MSDAPERAGPTHIWEASTAVRVCGLERTGSELPGDPKFVAGIGGKRVSAPPAAIASATPARRMSRRTDALHALTFAVSHRVPILSLRQDALS